MGIRRLTNSFWRWPALLSVGLWLFTPLLAAELLSPLEQKPALELANPFIRTGDRSVLLRWPDMGSHYSNRFQVSRSLSLDGPFQTMGETEQPYFADLMVTNGLTYYYRIDKVAPFTNSYVIANATPQTFTNDDLFLDYVQQTAFDYFWHEVNPANGLIKDRSSKDSPCSIAANGFGFSAICVGIERGWITRKQGRDRTLLTLKTFATLPQGEADGGTAGYKGWFYHFLDMNTGMRVWRCELSSIDTALLLAGVLHARQFFDGEDADEIEIRRLANFLVERVDKNWMMNRGDTLTMGWHPEKGFIESRWNGYNEGMLLYIMGLGVTKNPLPDTSWKAWTRGYKWEKHYGLDFVPFPPLFGHQYTHVWVDFREVTDDYLQPYGITYFENSRRATLAQQAYAAENPLKHKGYSSLVWGLTACDGPGRDNFLGYSARGAPIIENDDGTIAPTAAGGSFAFTPEISLPTLRHFYDEYREKIWTVYGFRDAFNLTADWWGPDVIGIDQGPILLMIENHRSGSVWKKFMQSPEIKRGMERAGFKPLANK